MNTVTLILVKFLSHQQYWSVITDSFDLPSTSSSSLNCISSTWEAVPRDGLRQELSRLVDEIFDHLFSENFALVIARVLVSLYVVFWWDHWWLLRTAFVDLCTFYMLCYRVVLVAQGREPSNLNLLLEQLTLFSNRFKICIFQLFYHGHNLHSPKAHLLWIFIQDIVVKIT